MPDIAFVSREQSSGKTAEELQAPAFAPAVAVETLSPGDSAKDVADKIDVYLRGGSKLVMIVDPRPRTIVLHDRAVVTTFTGDDEVRHEALPDFRLTVDAFFKAALTLEPA